MTKTQKSLFLLMGFVAGEMFDDQFGINNRRNAVFEQQIQNLKSCNNNIKAENIPKLDEAIDATCRRHIIVSSRSDNGSKRWLIRLMRQMKI